MTPKRWNDSPRTIVFLQNAWSPFYAGGEWPRESWVPALKASRSGKRLRLLVDDPEGCWNTTPIVGATPGSKVKPSPEWIRHVLETTAPEVVVTCGRQAEAAVMKEWDGPMLAVPHPAARVLTNALYEEARRLLLKPFGLYHALRQRRGRIHQQRL